MGEKEKDEKVKKRGKRGKKEEGKGKKRRNNNKKRKNILLLFPCVLFNIGHYDSKKTGKIFKNVQGGKDFSGRP